MDDSAIVMGTVFVVAGTGTIVALKNGRSPFKPIAGSLVVLIVLGSVSTFAPQVAKGLAVITLLSVMYRYGPDIFEILGGSSGSRSRGHF
jgi:hypothetical protein